MIPIEQVQQLDDFTKLTGQQQKFVIEYLQHGNSNGAVSIAYPNIKPENQAAYAHKLLHNPFIKVVLSFAKTGEQISDELFWDVLKSALLHGVPNERIAALRLVAEIKGHIQSGRKSTKPAAQSSDTMAEEIAERINSLPVGRILKAIGNGGHTETQG